MGELDKTESDRGARLEQVRLDDREPPGANGRELLRLWIPAQLLERRPAVRRGQEVARVEPREIAQIERPDLRRIPRHAPRVGLAEEVADQRLVGDGGEEARVDEDTDPASACEALVDEGAFLLDLPYEPGGIRRPAGDQPELADRLLDAADRVVRGHVARHAADGP